MIKDFGQWINEPNDPQLDDPWERQDQDIQEYYRMKFQEEDPNGLSMNTPGAKADEGKAPLEMLTQFGPSLAEVAKLLEFGAEKYSRSGWQHVIGGKQRYTSAMLRHLFKEEYELVDPETNLYHATAVAWNALARLHFILAENTEADKEEVVRVSGVPYKVRAKDVGGVL